jgi:long-chain acyl-CoA synthetase
VLSKLRQRLTGGRLRFFVSGGAPLGREVEEFFWSFGVPIYNGWGMTETSSGATSNNPRRHRFETVGTPLPGVRLRIAGDGEVLVDGPGNMLGYFRNEAATAEVLQDGWIHTGDVGELDGDGFLRITDRKKDLIKTAGGKFVAPQPLEAILQQAPIVERALVLGDERPYAVALIVPDWNVLRRQLGLDGEPESLLEDGRARAAIQRLLDDMNAELGSWERIKFFQLLAHDFSEEKGEITPTLKVKRRVVQERYREQIEHMYSGKGRPAEAAH